MLIIIVRHRGHASAAGDTLISWHQLPRSDVIPSSDENIDVEGTEYRAHEAQLVLHGFLD